MSGARRLQVTLPEPVNGVWTIPFKAESTREDVELFMEALESRVKPGPTIKRVVFGLSEIDALRNAAGRLLDMACYFRKLRKTSIEVWMPLEIYTALHEIPPHDLPRLPSKRARHQVVKLRGITIRIVPRPAQLVPNLISADNKAREVAQEPETVLSCTGQVRDVNGSVVTVSLFCEGDEIIGEFDKCQFPKKRVVPGLMFDYQAIVVSPGKTEIVIDFVTEQQATEEELVEGANEIRKEIEKEIGENPAEI